MKKKNKYIGILEFQNDKKFNYLKNRKHKNI
jgi:hypothetical protein